MHTLMGYLIYPLPLCQDRVRCRLVAAPRAGDNWRLGSAHATAGQGGFKTVRPTAAPAATATTPSATLMVTYPKARLCAPRSRRATASALNVENVVKPPQNPVPRGMRIRWCVRNLHADERTGMGHTPVQRPPRAAQDLATWPVLRSQGSASCGHACPGCRS